MTRTKTYLAAHYHRIARRKGKRRAVMAVAHSVLMIIYHMLKEKKPYEERGANYFDRLDAEQVQRYHVRRLEQLGYTVSLAAAGCFSEEGGGHLLAAPTVRFQFIEEHRQEYPVGLLCAALDVSLSGYCAWRKRPMSHHQREDDHLREQLLAVYHANRKVYGSPRLHAELQAQGIRCSRKRVARLMRTMGLAARRSRHRTRTTRSDASVPVAPTLLQRDFTASHPNDKWVGDITAIWTYEGWLYLAAVLDLFSRRVVGWAMAACQDETLVESAFHMAVLQRRPQAGLTFHSDRGSQYTSHQYQAVLAELRVTVSMSRRSNCWDNAVTESFFGTLKGECVDLCCFQSRSQARAAIFEYVEAFYNRVRRHSSLGYVSPVSFEQLNR